MSETPVLGTRPLRERTAEEVRALLARRKVSATQLAKAMQVSQAYVWRRLDGRTAFDVDDLETIARLLGVRVVDLLPREEPGEEVAEHKISFARSADRPVDNRPVRGPRQRDDRPDVRRPQRIRKLPGGTQARRTA